jgi:hypothetical protein
MKTSPWNKIHIEKHLLAQLVKEFLAFYQPYTQLLTDIRTSYGLDELVSVPDRVGFFSLIHRPAS